MRGSQSSEGWSQCDCSLEYSVVSMLSILSNLCPSYLALDRRPVILANTSELSGFLDILQPYPPSHDVCL